MTTALSKPSVQHFNAFVIPVMSHNKCIRMALGNNDSSNEASRLSTTMEHAH